jgi:hypothetical protein
MENKKEKSLKNEDLHAKQRPGYPLFFRLSF